MKKKIIVDATKALKGRKIPKKCKKCPFRSVLPTYDQFGYISYETEEKGSYCSLLLHMNGGFRSLIKNKERRKKNCPLKKAD